MKNIKAILSLLFLISVSTSCKKEVVMETGNNYFMVYLDTNPTGGYTISNTRFNKNPQQIAITDDSILIKQGGLYHFEGNININCIRNAAAYPVFYELLVRVKDKSYTLAQGYTNRNSSGSDIGGTNFSFDLPVDHNSGIRFTRNTSNASSGNVITRFSGYLIRKI